MNSRILASLHNAALDLEMKRRKLLSSNQTYRLASVLLKYTLRILAPIILILSFIFPPFLFFILLIGVFWLIFFFVPDPEKTYHDYIKEDILPSIFKQINPNYQYHPFGINNEALNNSGFFNKSFFNNRTFIKGEDRVISFVNEMKFDFFEVFFYREEINWLKSILNFTLILLLLPIAIFHLQISIVNGKVHSNLKFSRDTVKYYKGLFLYADFHKNFEGDVILIPKKLESNWEKFSDSVFGSTYSKMEVEDHTISSTYSVYTTDVQMGFYVLSPSLLQSIVQIIDKEKVQPMISLRSGKMYMTIPWDRDYFSVDINKPVNGAAYFTNYIEDIKSFEKIIKHLKLDVRIWSKS